MPIAPPNIADEEIEAGWRAVHGTVGPAPRVLRRRPFRQSTGLSGSHFEHVRIACGAARVDGLLKLGRLAGGLPTREWLFFAELAARVPVRVPRCLAVGPRPSGADGWVLM